MSERERLAEFLEAMVGDAAAYGFTEEVVADTVAYLRRERERWQPIESAPKDGTMVLMHAPVDGYEIAYVGFWGVGTTTPGTWWIGHDWGHLIAPLPTHWMPLPDPPERP